jgi:hypothetical protein
MFLAMKKFIILLTLSFSVPFFIHAQDLADALRFSNFQIQGTARAGGMGNAFGALGGDFTSISINPAGLGLYRSSEFVFTPAFNQTQVETSYRGNSMTDSKYNFLFNNLSYVSAISPRNQSETGLVSVNIGIGFNRLKDFNSTMLGGVNNMNGSFLDYVADNATLDIWSDFYEKLAWDADLLLFDEDAGVYWHDLEDAGYGQSMRKSIARQGAINEYSLAAGFNFNHKLYLGASLGIVDVFYRESSELREWDPNNSIPFFNEMKFNSYLRTSGTGLNGKIGLIYKPVNAVRLGASVHTPTFYNLHDVFETSMFSSVTYEDGNETYRVYSPYSEYDYSLETPLRANLSGAVVIGRVGLVSVDYEYVDYGSASLRRGGDGYNFVDENDEIAEVFRSVGNLRIGGELLASDNISLRAGYEYYPSAYNAQAFGATQPNAEANRTTFSGGLGYKSGGFFFDVAYRYSFMKDYDLMYPAPATDFYAAPEMAAFSNLKHKVMFTLGFKF